MDREKVIKGLELCLKTIDEPDCRKECPYYEACQKYEGRVIFQPLMRDTLALLKEQETKDTGHSRVFQCEKCGYGIDDIFLSTVEKKYPIVPKYCPNCGRGVCPDDRPRKNNELA